MILADIPLGERFSCAKRRGEEREKTESTKRGGLEKFIYREEEKIGALTFIKF